MPAFKCHLELSQRHARRLRVNPLAMRRPCDLRWHAGRLCLLRAQCPGLDLGGLARIKLGRFASAFWPIQPSGFHGGGGGGSGYRGGSGCWRLGSLGIGGLLLLLAHAHQRIAQVGGGAQCLVAVSTSTSP